MCIYQSYTYLIGWSNLNKWYYGVRFGNKRLPEEDLWVKYFTSSKYVKKLREQHGEPDVIQIRKKFNNYTDAICWEERVLLKINALMNDKWLNRNIRGAIAPMIGHNHPRFKKKTPLHVREKISIKNKGKPTWNKGLPRSKETINKIKNTIGDSRKGNKNSMYGRRHSAETIEKIKLKADRKGIKNPMYGKNHSETTKKILSQKNKGENSSGFIGYYTTPWGKFPSSTEAAAVAPFPIAAWTVSKWCRSNNRKKISRVAVTKSKLLKEEHIGKMFYDLGYSFEPNTKN